MDEDEGDDVIGGGEDSCAGESNERRLEARLSMVVGEIMQDEMALPDVAMREAARVRANYTIELASSEEEEEDVGVSAGMRDTNVKEAAGQAEQQVEADDLSQDEESTFIVKPAPHNLNSIWWRKAGFLKFCPFEHQDLG